MSLEQEDILRIKFYRRSALLTEVTVLAPLAFGVAFFAVIIGVAIAQGRCWLYEVGSYYNRAACNWALVGISVFVLFVVLSSIVSSVRRDRKELHQAFNYSEAEYKTFNDALEGVSIAFGLSAPPLVVLDIPSVNSIAFKDGKHPTVGVTAEALAAGLSSRDKEAMMAHEVAHIVLGDYFMASGSARFRYAGRALAAAFTLLALLAALAINVALLLFVVPFILPAAGVAIGRRVEKKTKVVYRHNDLIADSLTVRATSDPEALRETIGKMWSLSKGSPGVFAPGSRYPGYLFIARPLMSLFVNVGPIVSSPSGGNLLSVSTQLQIATITGSSDDFEQESDFTYKSVKERIDNLKAIERGQWFTLEKPLQRERLKTGFAFVSILLILAAVTLLLVLPWSGKSRAWDFATTNFIAKFVVDEQLSTVQMMEMSWPSIEGELSSLVNLVSAKVASGTNQLTLEEEIDVQVDAPMLKGLADGNIKWADHLKNKLKGIKIFGPDREYREYADLRMQAVDASIHYYWAAGRFASDVGAMLAPGTFDPAALSARLQAFQAEKQQIQARIDELNREIEGLRKELHL